MRVSGMVRYIEFVLSPMAEGKCVHPMQASGNVPLFPEDLAALQRVFDQLCRENRWPRASAPAQHYGRMLIDAYQAGTRDELLLLIAGRSFVSLDSKQRSPA